VTSTLYAEIEPDLVEYHTLAAEGAVRWHIPPLHAEQSRIRSELRRFSVLDCGRRWGKSFFAIDWILEEAREGYPVGWFAPAYKYLTDAWRDILRATDGYVARKNDAERYIELVTGGTIEGWTLEDERAGRSRKYKRAVVDEAALAPRLETAWTEAIRPTLSDFQGEALFCSTPKGLNYFHTLYERGDSADWPEWVAFRAPTATNPFIQASEIEAARRELPARIFAQEYEADFLPDLEGALWTRKMLDEARLPETAAPELARVVVAVDPAVTAHDDSDETGIVVAGRGVDGRFYVLADRSCRLSPDGWARRAVTTFSEYEADRIVGEVNNGGDLVETVVGHAAQHLGTRAPFKQVRASRGKQVRAEPIAALYEQGRVSHIGLFPELEAQMCNWAATGGDRSPDRMDALVWALTEIAIEEPPKRKFGATML
jgi:predicted phage terminase large subunit-like protein